MLSSLSADVRTDNHLVINTARLCLILFVAIITYKSLAPSQPALSYANFDKVLHAVAYGFLTLALLFAAPRMPLWQVFLWPTAYGILLEILQGQFGQGRSASFWDAAANMAGAALAIMGWLIIRHFRRANYSAP